ncbi:hypothetical protein NQD34_018478 [Periophthalmus magnuspinnatus]|nr:hypothetical protein NQD34_018478 [Periophthalmus magnuspinnatus]
MKLYKQYVKNPNTQNKMLYTKYKNKLTKIIRTSKQMYFTVKFNNVLGNQKESWKVLNEILSRTQKPSVLPDTVVQNELNGNTNLSNIFNNYFASVGKQLSKNICQLGATMSIFFRAPILTHSFSNLPVK